METQQDCKIMEPEKQKYTSSWAQLLCCWSPWFQKMVFLYNIKYSLLDVQSFKFKSEINLKKKRVQLSQNLSLGIRPATVSQLINRKLLGNYFDD